MQAAFTTVTMVSRSNLTSDDSLQYYCNGYSDQHRPDQHRREVVLEHSADELFACSLRRCLYFCPFEASTCTPTCKRVYSSSRLSSKHKRSSAAWWTSEYSSPTTTLSWGGTPNCLGLRRDIISRTPSQRWFPIFITSIGEQAPTEGGW